jgi:hypothetical protein
LHFGKPGGSLGLQFLNSGNFNGFFKGNHEISVG